MIKGSIHQEDIMSINIYAPNIRAPKYTKQILTELKGEINSNTIIVGDINTLLSTMDIYHPNRKPVRKYPILTLQTKYT